MKFKLNGQLLPVVYNLIFLVLFLWLSSTNMFIISTVHRLMHFFSSYLAHYVQSCFLTSDVNK